MRRIPACSPPRVDGGGTSESGARLAFVDVELEALIRALGPLEVVGRRRVDVSDLAYDASRVTEGVCSSAYRGRARTGTTSRSRR